MDPLPRGRLPPWSQCYRCDLTHSSWGGGTWKGLAHSPLHTLTPGNQLLDQTAAPSSSKVHPTVVTLAWGWGLSLPDAQVQLTPHGAPA